MKKKEKEELKLAIYLTRDLDKVTISEDDYFRYSIVLSKQSKGLYETLDNAFVGFNKNILKTGSIIVKKTKSYKIVKTVNLVEAPESYIRSNCNLYIKNNNKKKKKKK